MIKPQTVITLQPSQPFSPMTSKTVSLDLMEFVESKILPRYSAFDKAHNIEHVTKVVRSSLKLAVQLGTDINMSYVIAAYHDLGMSGPRATHHISGGRILQNDMRLKKWFSPAQIKIMKEAVEDHRASASHEPRSIYGRIIAEADRDISTESVFRRTVQYGLEHFPDKDKNEHWERFLEHMNQKYSCHGYIRLWIPGSENEKNLSKIRVIIEDRTLLRTYFDRYFDEETCQE